ncbi:MAG: hypothetical protein F6K17_14805 [Okeania sp. SIO3C4]|nr:hypothetical protein [Okeania sp. SIO3C4]
MTVKPASVGVNSILSRYIIESLHKSCLIVKQSFDGQSNPYPTILAVSVYYKIAKKDS